MMLMLEKWDSHELELACLLDESPFQKYNATEVGEPWRADSALTAAARSVDLEGSAWLYVVYESDPPRTWGSKRVKLVAGGIVLRANTTAAGVETGMHRRLKFEAVARSIFHNVVGNDSPRPYIIVKEAAIEYEPRKSSSVFDEPPDPLFGWSERWSDRAESPHQPPTFTPPPAVCVIAEFVTEKCPEKWVLSDVGGLSQFRFQLTEYQRRPYVRLILARLGFVRDPDLGDAGNPPRLEEVCAGHLHNLATTLNALTQVTSTSVFDADADADKMDDSPQK